MGLRHLTEGVNNLPFAAADDAKERAPADLSQAIATPLGHNKVDSLKIHASLARIHF